MSDQVKRVLQHDSSVKFNNHYFYKLKQFRRQIYIILELLDV